MFIFANRPRPILISIYRPNTTIASLICCNYSLLQILSLACNELSWNYLGCLAVLSLCYAVFVSEINAAVIIDLFYESAS